VTQQLMAAAMNTSEMMRHTNETKAMIAMRDAIATTARSLIQQITHRSRTVSHNTSVSQKQSENYIHLYFTI